MTRSRRRRPAVLAAVLGAALMAWGVGVLLQAPSVVVEVVGALPAGSSGSVGVATVPPAPPGVAPAATPVPSRSSPPSPPAVLVVPAAGVVAEVRPIGVVPSGALQLPEDPAVTGWWAAGAMPGEDQGSAVLAGHVDAAARGAGAMKSLVDLSLPAEVRVVDGAGGVLTYQLVARRTFDKKALPPDLFRRDGPPQLVLVTCGGRFDERRGHYEENVVLYAVPSGV